MWRRLALTVCILSVAACAAPSEEPEALGASEDALTSTPLRDADMKKIPRPAGMPAAWVQPDSTGWLEERGKCGPTAVANTLRLYGIEVSPQEADRNGVHWWVGSRGINVEAYMQEKHPQLGCTLEHPTDGKAFLRRELAAGHPVMVWYNAEGSFLASHWVTVVGLRGQGADELAIVMSWGSYYTIPLDKLDAAWRNVYWIRRPSVVCDVKTTHLAR